MAQMPLAAADWTLIYYIDGDNNLAPYYENDLYYISQAGSDANVNVLVLFDWESVNDTKAYYAGSSGLIEIPLSSIDPSWVDEVNMGDPYTLFAFADYCFSNYPADHYMVIPQDHGGAWEGCCWDWTSDDNLDLGDLDLAFSSMKSSIGKNVDLVFFNDCEMSNMEVCYQISDSVDYMAGSETIGWTNNYDNESCDIISYLKSNPETLPVSVCEYLVDIAELVDDYSYTTQAVSAVNLTRMSELFGHLEVVIDILALNMSVDPSPFVYARLDCVDIEGSNIIDLPQFLANLMVYSSDTTLIGECSQILAVLGPQEGSHDTMIISNRWTDAASFCNGLSIFFPVFGDQYYLDYYVYGNDFAAASDWANFIGQYWIYGIIPDAYEPDDEWSIANPIVDDEVQAHSIDGSGSDVDWVHFQVSEESFAEVWTDGPSGDTIIELYLLVDGTPEMVTWNDDHNNLWSYIGAQVSIGDYYLKVMDFAQDSNIPLYYLGFNIFAWNPDSYEPDDSWDQANLLEQGIGQDHSIHIPSDMDWVTFDVTEVSLIELWTNGSVGDTFLELYYHDGYSLNWIAEDDDSGEGMMSYLGMVLTPGTYYASVHSYGYGSTIDQYQINLTTTTEAVPDVYEPDDAWDQGSELFVDEDQVRSIHDNGGNVDWATITITEPSEVLIGTYGDYGDTVLELYDSTLTMIDSNDDYFDAWSLIIITLDPGQYYILVYENGQDQDILQYDLALRMSTTLPDAYEPDDQWTMANEIVSGVQQEHSIDQFGLDEDWVWFDVTQTCSVSIWTTCSYGDFILQLYLYNGGSMDYWTGSMNLIQIVLAPGTYYLEVQEDWGQIIDLYTLDLILTLDAVADTFEPDDSWDTANEIVENLYQDHSIHNDGADQDWVTFTVYSTMVVTITTEGYVGDTVLELYDSSLVLIAMNDDYTGAWSMISMELTAGQYYLRVTEHDQNEDIFYYYLIMTTGGVLPDAYEPDDEYDMANEIVPGVVQEHSIHEDGSDTDWVYFTLTEYTLVQVWTGGLWGDTKMWLFNSTLGLIAFNDDYNGYWSMIFVDLGPGTYYVQVSEYGGNDIIELYTLEMAFLIITPDSYEPDDTWEDASSISDQEQQLHSIHDDGADVDWVSFGVFEMSTVTISTYSGFGDLAIDLYVLNGTALDLIGSYFYGGLLVIYSGTYYAQISEIGQDSAVYEYYLNLMIVPGMTTINIYSDSEMVTWASAMNWDGDGSESDPYVIEGYVIDAHGAQNCIAISYTTLHFVIRDCSLSNASSHALILDNVINGRVEQCTIHNEYGYGQVMIVACQNIWFEGNQVTLLSIPDASFGIELRDSRGLMISGNSIICDSGYGFGLFLWDIEDSVFLDNEMIGCGFALEGAPFNTTIDVSNTVNGAPVLFVQNVDMMGAEIGDGAGQILLNNVTNAVINGQSLSFCAIPIEVIECSEILLQNNEIADSWIGILVGWSNNITLIGNTISDQMFAGLRFWGCADCGAEDNTIQNCRYGVTFDNCLNCSLSNSIVSGSQYGGISIQYSQMIVISGCEIIGNLEGIAVAYSDNNIVQDNLIVDNLGYGVYLSGTGNLVTGNELNGNNGATSVYNPSHIQALDNGVGNHWNGTGSGNRWGDWLTPDDDMDGIVDEPYAIDGAGGAMDLLPLAGIDDDPPVTICVVTGPHGDGQWYRGTVTVSLSATDSDSGVNEIWYRIDGDDWLLYAGSFEIAGQGDHLLEFYAVDNANNSEATREMDISIDTTMPTLNVGEPAGHVLILDAIKVYNVSSLTAGWTGADAPSGVWKYEVKLANGAWISKGTAITHTFTGLVTGQYVITVNVYDLAGNTVEDSITIWIDVSPPLVVLTLPNQAYLQQDHALINWSASDVPSGLHHYELLVDGKWLNLGLNLTFNLDGMIEGVNEYILKAVDRAGNIALREFNITVDTVAPVITLIGPPGLTNDTTPTFTISAHDETSGLQTIMIRMDGGLWLDIGIVTSYTVAELADGDHTVSFKVVDKAGNSWEQLYSTFEVDHTCPTCSSHQPTGTAVLVNTTIEVHFSENMTEVWATVDGEEVEVELDGDTAVLVTGEELLRGHTYSVVVGGKDLAGNVLEEMSWSFTTKVNITVHGTVLDENGDPIVDAEIWMNGVLMGTTDENGDFTLEVAPGQHTLTIKAEGMEDMEMDFDPEGGDLSPVTMTAAATETPILLFAGVAVVIGAIAVASVLLFRARKH